MRARLFLYPTQELFDSLQKLSTLEGRSLNNLCLRLLNQKVEELQKEDATQKALPSPSQKTATKKKRINWWTKELADEFGE